MDITEKKWIQKAGVDKPGHKGQLHRSLGVPQEKGIPAKKLAKALHSKNPHIRHMAQFAKNVRHESVDQEATRVVAKLLS